MSSSTKGQAEKLPLRLIVLGMSFWKKDELAVFFKQQCEGVYQIVEDDGDILIADLDDFKNSSELVAFSKANPKMPAIFISYNVHSEKKMIMETVVVVKKPYLLPVIKDHLNDYSKTVFSLDYDSTIIEQQVMDDETPEDNNMKKGASIASVLSGVIEKSAMAAEKASRESAEALAASGVAAAAAEIVAVETAEAVEATTAAAAAANEAQESADIAEQSTSNLEAVGYAKKMAEQAVEAALKAVAEADEAKEAADYAAIMAGVATVETEEAAAANAEAVKAALAVSDAIAVKSSGMAREPKGVSQPKEKHKQSYNCTRSDIDLLDLKAVEKERYDPNRFLYGHLARLSNFGRADMKGDKIITLTVGEAVFSFSPDKRTVKVNIRESKLRALAALPIYKETVLISAQNEEWNTIGGNSYVTKELLWDTATWAARCRLSIGTDLDTPIGLSHWPNMTRLRDFPHAKEIAALWIKKPTSLANTILGLGLPQRDVFSFYTATQAIGESYYAETKVSETEAEITIKTTTIEQREKGLFARILKHLKGEEES